MDTTIYFTEKTLTQQHNKKECDINNIMAKYQKTGVIDHLAKYEAHYHDCDSTTFHEAQNIIANAFTMFEELPAIAREKFDNDPSIFLDYVQDPNNQASLHGLGLANAPLQNETATEEKQTKPDKSPSPDKKSEATNPKD